MKRAILVLACLVAMLAVFSVPASATTCTYAPAPEGTCGNPGGNVAGPPSTGTPALARTGSNTDDIVRTALLLVTAGGLLVFVARRRASLTPAVIEA